MRTACLVLVWVTWSDWEEGTEVESGIDNGLAIDAHLDGTQLAWTTGDDSTVDHYAVYATTDGANAVLLGTTHDHSFELAAACPARGSAFVIAVGKPMIRDTASAPITF